MRPRDMQIVVFDPDKIKFFFSCKFFSSIFDHQNPWIRIGLSLKCRIRIRMKLIRIWNTGEWETAAHQEEERRRKEEKEEEARRRREELIKKKAEEQREKREERIRRVQETVYLGSLFSFAAVLRIRIRRIHMFLGLPNPDPLVRDPDPDLLPSIKNSKKNMKNIDSYCFETSIWLFIFE